MPRRSTIKDSLYIRDGTVGSDKPEFLATDLNPHVINPKKGYIVACNNRIAQAGLGSTFPTTARAIRATNMLDEAIKANTKLTVDIMKKMQTNVVDEYAKIMLPHMLGIVEKYKSVVYKVVPIELDELCKNLKDWPYDMIPNDMRALIYNIWHSKLYESLLKQKFSDPNLREMLIDSPYTQDFLGKMLERWADGEELDSEICEDGHGAREKCAHLVVSSLLETQEFIVSKIGRNKVRAGF